MNNINSPDATRAVVTDGTGAKQGTEVAKQDKTSGKKLPVTEQPVRAETLQRSNPAAKSSAQVEKAVAQLNDYVQSLQRDLSFSMDEDLGRTVVKVIDRNSQKVIRQIPNETALQLARNLKEQQQLQQQKQLQQELDLPEPGREAPGASLGLISTKI